MSDTWQAAWRPWLVGAAAGWAIGCAILIWKVA